MCFVSYNDERLLGKVLCYHDVTAARCIDRERDVDHGSEHLVDIGEGEFLL